EILALSGASLPDLRAHLDRWPADATWDEVGRRTARSRREWDPRAPWRLLVVLERDRADRVLSEVREVLAAGDPARLPAGVYVGSGPVAGKLAVLFPGQGAQYVGMLRDLVCHFPAALDAVDRANAVGREQRPDAPRLVDRLVPPPALDRARKAA